MEQRICRSVSTESRRFREVAGDHAFAGYMNAHEFAGLCLPSPPDLAIRWHCRAPQLHKSSLHKLSVGKGVCNCELVWSSEFAAGLSLPSPSDFRICPGIFFRYMRCQRNEFAVLSHCGATKFAGLRLPTFFVRLLSKKIFKTRFAAGGEATLDHRLFGNPVSDKHAGVHNSSTAQFRRRSRTPTLYL